MDAMMVDISDYLTDDDRRSIARDEFRKVCARRTEEDFQRILSNAAYDIVGKEVDAVFDEGMAAAVKAKAIKVIAGLSAFTVFRKPDAWDRAESKGWTHLQSAIDEARPLIAARVNQIVADMDEIDLRELVADQIGEAIIAKLTAKEPQP